MERKIKQLEELAARLAFVMREVRGQLNVPDKGDTQ